jgi:hypothetical protein
MKQTKKPRKNIEAGAAEIAGTRARLSNTTDGASARRARRKSDPSFADRLPEVRQDVTWRPGRS